ncbi:MAG: GAF domain-containing protein [Deltaproteobacteria bacterium]|nr:GAF domain-containing protein [Deltaproteobacteria bacterium]
MGTNEKIDIDTFKVVTRAIAESSDLNIMVNHLTQLLTGALGIKGCTLFVLNPDSKELELLANFGLSLVYLNKGTVLSDKSIGSTLTGRAAVISDTSKTDQLQYPEDAQKEGIAAMVSIPIEFYGQTIGVLRLYHSEIWDISETDLDSLVLVGKNIALAMMYTRLLNAVQDIKDSVYGLHPDLIPLFPGQDE